MPSFSVPSLPSLQQQSDEPDFGPPAPPPAAPPPQASGEPGIGELVAGAAGTLAAAAAANAQLAVVRQVRKAQKLAYMAPFYAKAAVELKVEETQAAIDDAPRYYSEQLALAQAAATAKVEETVAEITAAPDRIANTIAAEVKGQLDQAQAQSTALLDQAKGEVDTYK